MPFSQVPSEYLFNELSGVIRVDDNHDDFTHIWERIRMKIFRLVLTLMWLSFNASATVSLSLAAEPGPVKLRANFRSPAIGKSLYKGTITIYLQHESEKSSFFVHLGLGNRLRHLTFITEIPISP